MSKTDTTDVPVTPRVFGFTTKAGHFAAGQIFTVTTQGTSVEYIVSEVRTDADGNAKVLIDPVRANYVVEYQRAFA